MAGYYDKNKDYSKELQRTDLSASERDRLTKERENKIADKYGGQDVFSDLRRVQQPGEQRQFRRQLSGDLRRGFLYPQ